MPTIDELIAQESGAPSSLTPDIDRLVEDEIVGRERAKPLGDPVNNRQATVDSNLLNISIDSAFSQKQDIDKQNNPALQESRRVGTAAVDNYLATLSPAERNAIPGSEHLDSDFPEFPGLEGQAPFTPRVGRVVPTLGGRPDSTIPARLNELGLTREFFANIPEMVKQTFKQQAGGITLAVGEQLEQDLSWRSRLGRLAGAVVGPGVGIDETDILPRSVRVAKELGDWATDAIAQGFGIDSSLVEGGQQLRDEALARIKELQPAEKTFLQEVITSGTQSAALALPGMAVSMITRNPTALLAAFGASTYGDSYGTARDAGKSPEESHQFALRDAGIEVGTEIGPVKIMLGASKTAIRQTLTRLFKSEMGGETLATIGQKVNSAMSGVETMPLDQWLGELWEELKVTWATTAILTPLQGATANLAGKAVDKISGVQDITGELQEITPVEQAAVNQKAARAGKALKAAMFTTAGVAETDLDLSDEQIQRFIDHPELSDIAEADLDAIIGDEANEQRLISDLVDRVSGVEVVTEEDIPASIGEISDESLLESQEADTLKTERPRTFEPSQVSLEALPTDISQELPPLGGGKYFHAPAQNLQSWLDTNGDGFLYRVTVPQAFEEGFDVGDPRYKHQFPRGESKVHSFTSSLENAKKLIKEKGPGAIVYRVLPEDIEGEFTVQVHDGEQGVIHAHSPKPVHQADTIVLYANGKWEESASEIQEHRRLGEERRNLRRGDESALAGRREGIRGAVGEYVGKAERLKPFSSDQIESVPLREAVESGLVSEDEGAVIDGFMESLPESLRESFDVVFSSQEFEPTAAQLKAHDIKSAEGFAVRGALLEKFKNEARDTIVMFGGSDVTTFFHEFGELSYKRLLTSEERNYVTSLKSEAGVKVAPNEWFSDQLQSFMVQEKETVFKPKLQKILSRVADTIRKIWERIRTTHRTPALDEIFRDILAGNRRIELEPVDTSSPEFQRWSKGHEIVEGTEIANAEPGKGYVFQVFHGTTHNFDIFDPTQKGQKEGQFGAVNYFTSDQDDADVNYAGLGPDLTNRIESAAERIVDNIQDLIDDEGIEAVKEKYGAENYNEDTMEMARNIVRIDLHGGDPQTLELFVRSDKPAFIGGETVTLIETQDELADPEEWQTALDEAWEEVKDENDAEDDDREDFEFEIADKARENEGLENLLLDAIDTAIRDSGNDPDSVLGSIGDIVFETEITATDLEETLRNNEDLSFMEDPETGDLIGFHLIGQIFKELGFDSIVLQNANGRFENMDMGSETSHIHVFEETPANIKSVTENVGAFDPLDPRITASIGERPVKTRVRAITGQVDLDENLVRESVALKAAFTKAAQAARAAERAGDKKGVAKEKARMKVILESVKERSQAQERRTKALDQIKKELKSTKVKKQAGKPRGKFTAEIQEIFNTLQADLKLTKVEAFNKIAKNLEDHKDNIPPYSVAIENRLLSVIAAQDAGIGRLGFARIQQQGIENLLSEIKGLKGVGLSAREAQQAGRLTAIHDNREKFIDLVGGIPEGINAIGEEGVTLKGIAGIKQGIRNALIAGRTNSVVGWKDLLDIISFHDKTSKPGESAISQFGDVLDANNAEKQGNINAMSAFRGITFEAYGLDNDSDMVKKFTQDAVLHDLGEFKTQNDVFVKLRMTRAEARKRAMEIMDPTLHDTIFTPEGMGWTQEMADAVFDFLTPQDEDFITKQLEFYQEYYEGINEVYKVIYGVNLPKNINYSPIAREGISQDVESTLGEFFNEISLRASAETAGGLKSRVTSKLPLRPQSDISVIQQHVADMEHFKAWSEKIRDLNAVFGNSEVRQAIRVNFGDKIDGEIQRFIVDMARGGTETSKRMATLDKMMGRYARSVLSLKPSIFLKQLTSTIAFADSVPATYWTKEILKIQDIPKAVNLFFDEETGSNLVKSRWAKGDIERDISNAMKSSEFARLRAKPSFLNMMMFNVKLGDMGAIIVGGYPVYKYHRSQGLSHEESIKRFESVTESTQQSADISQQSSWQRGGSFAKLFTMFMSSPNQYLRKEIGAIRNMAAGRIDAKQFAKTMLIYHIALPMFFQLASDRFVWSGDEDDEALFPSISGEQKRAMILGSLNGFFIVGDALEAVISKSLDLKIFGFENPLWSIVNDALKAWPLLEWDDIDPEDFIKAIRGLAGASGAVTGLPGKQAVDIVTGFNETLSGEYEIGIAKMMGWSPHQAERAAERSEE